MAGFGRVLARFGAFLPRLGGGARQNAPWLNYEIPSFMHQTYQTGKFTDFYRFLPCSRFLLATVLVKTGPPFFDPF